MFPTRGRSFLTLKARVLCVYRTLPALSFVRLGSAASCAEKTRKNNWVVREFSPQRLRAPDGCAQSIYPEANPLCGELASLGRRALFSVICTFPNQTMHLGLVLSGMAQARASCLGSGFLEENIV